jgi:hypothetical protein
MLFILRQFIQRGYTRINKGVLVIFFTTVFLSIIPLSFHVTTKYVFFFPYLIFLFFLFYDKKYLSPFVDVATIFMLVLIIFAIIGFLYAFVGKPPIMEGSVQGGRSYYWYLTTGAPKISNLLGGNLIRPAGVYNEPGALSYYLCTICFLRVFAKKSDTVTFVLLLLGNITFSAIHAIIFILFVLHLAVKYKKKKVFSLYAIVVITATIVVYLPIKETMDSLLFTRFTKANTKGIIEGTNRGLLFNNAMGVIKEDNTVLIWGMPRDSDGLSPLDREKFKNIDGDRYYDNPLSPILQYGIFVAWLYYFYLSFFLFCGVIDRKHFFIYVAIFMMLLQRPDFLSYSITSIPLILFLTSYDLLKNRIKKRMSVKKYSLGATSKLLIWENKCP